MDSHKVVHPEPVDQIKPLALEEGRYALIIHSRHLIVGFDKILPQQWVVDLSHYMIIEIGLVPAVQDSIRHLSTQKAPEQRLGLEIGILYLRRKTEKEFPEVDIGKGPRHCRPCESGAESHRLPS